MTFPGPATIVFTGGPWVWVGAGLATIGAVLAIADYRRRHRGRGSPVLAPLVLRILALALLALALAEPAWIGEEAEPGANLVAVVADNSAGMQISDAGEDQTRAEQLAGVLMRPDGSEGPWLETLGETFALRRFAMDGKLRRVNGFAALDFGGSASAIGGSLKSLERRFAGRPVAAVVILTDGNATDEPDLGALGELPPVYPVVMGSEAPARDLGITATNVSQSSFEDAPVTIRTDVVARGHRGETVTVHLENSTGDEIERHEFTPGADSETRSIRFLHRPPRSGVQFYRIKIGNRDGSGREATEANNTRLVTVNRGRGPYRVLYLAGRPNWEYKFLNRSLAADDELEMVGLIRVARREPKFRWRGRDGENLNPLFRGFNPDDDTAEYDQPVLVRLYTRDEHELSSGFPRAAEDLFDYHAVIIDDLECSFFTVDQMDLLEDFVSRRGGSLLMLGGAETFAHGGYDKSPIARMLPVHLGRPARQAPGTVLRLDLTRDGWLSPWVRLRENETGERERIEAMSPFKAVNRIAGIKPGASVLAQVDDGGTKRPALAVQRFGKGRVGALMLGDLWRWGFRVPEHRPDMEKAWRQLLRWLVADVPAPVAVDLKPAGEATVRARIEVRGKDFEPLADARVQLTVRHGENAPVELAASPSETEPGVFEVMFVSDEVDPALVTAAATNADGEAIGDAEDGWASNPAADEFKRLKPNRTLLEALAAKTGGRVLTPGELSTFAADLPGRNAPNTRTWSRSLWHTPLAFLLVLACFAGEWILRRRSGMA